ncbi:MAG: hypothetical protein EXS46_01255 [Candidatus Taylorbacteria bacterium]|nr:hypothetical protein [Candidatus Taylorbacteria bacterium]
MNMHESFEVPPLSDEIDRYEDEVAEKTKEKKIGEPLPNHTHVKQGNSHIEGEFDPVVELEKVKALTGVKKQNALDIFKEKLSFQKKGIALMQEQIISEIRNNPDLSEEVMMTFVGPFERQYGLTHEQILATKNVVCAFYLKHNAVKAMRESHPDDVDLFAALFGRRPIGKVECIEGPVTLYFRCYDERDYAYIYGEKFLTRGEVTQEDILLGNKTSGVSLGVARQSDLRGCLIAENVNGVPDEATHIHEEQHAIKRIFQSSLLDDAPEVSALERWQRGEPLSDSEDTERYSFKRSSKEVTLFSVLEAKDDTERALSLVRWLRYKRELIEESAKDEIFAYLKTIPLRTFENPVLREDPAESAWNEADVYRALSRSKKDGGLYDYFADEKSELLKAILSELGPKKAELINRSMEKVFVTEYHTLIRDGIDAFLTLRRRGNSVEKTIGLLTAEPLRKWPKVVGRLS